MYEITELKKYLDKLRLALDNQALFSLGNKKYINKQMIDDILCCVEASFPEDFKKYEKEFGNIHALKTSKVYTKLTQSIRNKSFFSKNIYVFYYNETVPLIEHLKRTISSDLEQIKKQNHNI